jgi:hypothetical protein
MTKHTKNKDKDRFNVTVTFCDDEEACQEAYEKAIRAVLGLYLFH